MWYNDEVRGPSMQSSLRKIIYFALQWISKNW